jgi:hypothetical protein
MRSRSPRITANAKGPSPDLLTSCEQARDEIAIAANYRQRKKTRLLTF